MEEVGVVEPEGHTVAVVAVAEVAGVAGVAGVAVAVLEAQVAFPVQLRFLALARLRFPVLDPRPVVPEPNRVQVCFRMMEKARVSWFPPLWRY